MSELSPFAIFGGVFILVWTIGTYNKFIKYRNMIEEGWSIIDVALKRRANLIPKLISSVQGYASHEATVLEDITAQRVGSVDSSESREAVTAQESKVSRGLGNLLGVAESNPDLKANTVFIELQEALNLVELEIAQSRNTFNQRIRMMNTLVEQFPSNIIAKIFSFTRDNYFQLELATEREMPSTPWDSA